MAAVADGLTQRFTRTLDVEDDLDDRAGLDDDLGAAWGELRLGFAGPRDSRGVSDPRSRARPEG